MLKNILKTVFALIFTLFCQVMALMIAPFWFDQPLFIPKKQPVSPISIPAQPEKFQPAPNLAHTKITLETIKKAQIDHLAAKKAQILQDYGISEQQLDCQASQNQQILKQAYSYNLRTDQFLANAEHCLATCPTGCLKNCFDSKTAQFIGKLIKNSEGDLDQIIIGSCKTFIQADPADHTKMFAYCSALTPGKHLLGIDTNSYLVKNLNQSVSHHGHEISCQLLFAQLIGHELCHIKYQDNLTVTLLSGLSAKIDTTIYEAFCEERADILSVVNCPDPLAVAEYLYDNCAEGLYIHRKSPTWQQLINDLKSCQNN